MAALDAFDLLDEYESELFTRSFHHTAAPVQDEIKRLQAEIASDESLLPNEKPDGSLRQRVLEAVARTIDAEAANFRPLARIGRLRYEADAVPPHLRSAGSTRFWRAACFVLAGISVVMAYFLAEGLEGSHELAMATLLNDATRVQAILGTTTTDFLLDDSRKIELRSKDSSLPYEAALFVNHRTGQAAILMDQLPRTKGDGYILQVVLETGETQRLQRFPSTGAFGGVKIVNLSTRVLASVAYWEITDLAGTVLLTSAA